MTVHEWLEKIVDGLVWAVVLGALIGILGMMGCSSAPARVIERPVIVPRVERCLDAPAPVWEAIPDPVVCKKGLLCYPTDVAVTLVDNIGRLRDWAIQAMTLCAKNAPVK